MLVALASGMSGCALRRTVRLDLSRSTSPSAAFSDERTRRIVRETRELIDLRAQDYLVGPDDVLTISIFEWELADETKTLDFRVSETGAISIPVLGPVTVAGQSLQQIQKAIEESLGKSGILQQPRVAVVIKEFRSRRISVVGAVPSPGVYALHRNVSTLLDMLTLAGGPNQDAGRAAHIIRSSDGPGESLRLTVDLNALLAGGDEALNPVLCDGDVVYVPRAQLVYIYGEVKQAGGYALRESLCLLDAIALAGGFGELADRNDCRLIRRSGGTEQVVPVNIGRVERGRAPNLELRENDFIFVPKSPALIASGKVWDLLRGVFTFTYRLGPN
jgi:polysaccharide export outer membrane protein